MSQIDEHKYLTTSEFLVQHQGRIGRNALYDYLRDGTIPCLRIGRKILIPADALDLILQKQMLEVRMRFPHQCPVCLSRDVYLHVSSQNFHCRRCKHMWTVVEERERTWRGPKEPARE